MNTSLLPIHPDGWRFIGIFALVTLFLFLLHPFLGFIGCFLTGWCTYFFRDPPKVVPQGSGFIVSPADGKIVAIEDVVPPADFGMGSRPLTRISIFLNVFDIHVNRIPAEGTIVKKIYHPGRFFNASFDKASDQNERLSLVLAMDKGPKIAFIQIAGWIARRIRCDVEEGDSVNRGSRYGLIRFGSRADVYLPEGVSPLVVKGQRTVGGETILADWQASQQELRKGRVL